MKVCRRWCWNGVCVAGTLALACQDAEAPLAQASSGAGGSRAADAAPPGCSSDTECPGGFCDRTGICEVAYTPRRFGMSCQWEPTLPTGQMDGHVFVGCGAYLCVDRVCRSCASDAECRILSGATGQCRSSPEGGPGYSCGAHPPDARAPTFQPRVDPTLLGVRVERIYPHARDAFTQGLVYQDGWLYESTGLEGSSSLRRVELETGRIDYSVALEADVFGEGLATLGESLLQLSYQNGRAFVYDRETFTVAREFSYEGEGWGLCYDGRRLVMSDGSNVLQFRDPVTFEQVGALEVNLDRFRFARLNELECVGDQILANVFGQRQIVRIDAATGRVTGWVDTGTLLLREGVADSTGADVLNGIAYVPERDRLLLTGKYWPSVFEVAIVPLGESYAEP